MSVDETTAGASVFGARAGHRASPGSKADPFATEFLFGASPVPAMIQDWSPVWEWIDRQRAADVVDLGPVFDADPDLVIEVISQVRILAVNQAFLEFERVTPEHVVGSAFRREAISKALPDFRGHLEDLYRGESTAVHHYRTTSRSGREVAITVRYVEHPKDRNLRLVTAQDFTDVARVEDALLEATAAKDRFVASVAHELRTPMTAVVGFASELETRFSEMPTHQRDEIVAILARESREVAAIVDDLLVAARADIGELTMNHEPVHLVQAARDVMQGLDCAIRVEGTPEVTAWGDSVRVRQIIRNLITNAVRYGGANCRLRVGVDVETAVLEVRDDGDGIPTELQDQIFQPYGRASGGRAVSGSVGLGLSVARQLARAMDGDLVFNRDHDDTVFTLSLPRWDGDQWLRSRPQNLSRPEG